MITNIGCDLIVQYDLIIWTF